MTDNPKYPQRKSPRLQGYDYSRNGAYFVTICTHNRHHLLGHVSDDEMILSAYGQIADSCWRQIPDHFEYADVDLHVVMPNHMYGIIVIQESGKSSLSTSVGSYKSIVTRLIRQKMGTKSRPIWQGRFHEHIIRNEVSLNFLRQYVLINPTRWHKDKLNG